MAKASQAFMHPNRAKRFCVCVCWLCLFVVCLIVFCLFCFVVVIVRVRDVFFVCYSIIALGACVWLIFFARWL